jgi:hypothetical protein
MKNSFIVLFALINLLSCKDAQRQPTEYELYQLTGKTRQQREEDERIDKMNEQQRNEYYSTKNELKQEADRLEYEKEQNIKISKKEFAKLVDKSKGKLDLVNGKIRLGNDVYSATNSFPPKGKIVYFINPNTGVRTKEIVISSVLRTTKVLATQNNKRYKKDSYEELEDHVDDLEQQLSKYED